MAAPGPCGARRARALRHHCRTPSRRCRNANHRTGTRALGRMGDRARHDRALRFQRRVRDRGTLSQRGPHRRKPRGALGFPHQLQRAPACSADRPSPRRSSHGGPRCSHTDAESPTARTFGPKSSSLGHGLSLRAVGNHWRRANADGVRRRHTYRALSRLRCRSRRARATRIASCQAGVGGGCRAGRTQPGDPRPQTGHARRRCRACRLASRRGRRGVSQSRTDTGNRAVGHRLVRARRRRAIRGG